MRDEPTIGLQFFSVGHATLVFGFIFAGIDITIQKLRMETCFEDSYAQ